MRRRVALIGTGGTISSRGRNRLDLVDYELGGPMLQADELLACVPEASAEFDVVPVRFRAVASNAIETRDWLDLNELVHRVATDAKPDGIVVTHGTATLEETAQRGVLVVMSCRAGAGRILDSHAVRSSGFIPADNLNPQKARILAMLALAKTQDRVEIRRMFREY